MQCELAAGRGWMDADCAVPAGPLREATTAGHAPYDAAPHTIHPP